MQRKYLAIGLLVALCLTATLAVPTVSVVNGKGMTSKIHYLSYQGSIETKTNVVSSVLGGAIIELHGQKYSNEAIYNYVHLQSYTEGIDHNPAYSTAPSAEDAFMSNAGLGKMVYTTKSVVETLRLAPGAYPPINVGYHFWMEAIHNGAHNPIYCSGNKHKCTLTHAWTATPFLFGVVPPTFGQGQTVSAIIQARLAASSRADKSTKGNFVKELKFGGESVDGSLEAIEYWWYWNKAVQGKAGAVKTEASSDVKARFDTGFTYTLQQATVKTISETDGVVDLYVARTRAMITNVTPNNFFYQKGTRVTIEGTGFNLENPKANHVVLGGYKVDIDYISNDEGNAQTIFGFLTDVAQDQTPPTGFTRSYYKAAQGEDAINEISHLDGKTPVSQTYYGGADTQWKEENFCEVLDSFFSPPVTGEYKFYASTKNDVEIYLNDDSSSAAFDVTKKLAGIGGDNGFRKFYGNEDQTFTALTAGESYRFTIRNCQGRTDGYLSVGVEFKCSAGACKTNLIDTANVLQSKDRWFLELPQEVKRHTFKVALKINDNPAGKKFRFQFELNEGQPVMSSEYTAAPSSGALNDDLFGENGKLKGKVNGNFRVSREGDAEGYIYGLYLSKSVDHTSAENVGLVGMSLVNPDPSIFEEKKDLAGAGCQADGCNASNLDKGLHTVGNLPLKGKWKVQITFNYNGQDYNVETDDMNYNHDYGVLRSRIEDKAGALAQCTDIWRTSKYWHYEDGSQFAITLFCDPAVIKNVQFTVKASAEEPLQGQSTSTQGIFGPISTTSNNTPISDDPTSLFFYILAPEWFTALHDDTKKYTTVTVEDTNQETPVHIPAYFNTLQTAEIVFSEETNPNTITATTFDQDTGAFTITGTFAGKPQAVWLGGRMSSDFSINGGNTEITGTIKNPMAGQHLFAVVYSGGPASNEGVTATDVEIKIKPLKAGDPNVADKIESIAGPDEDIFLSDGQLVRFCGTGFPTTIDEAKKYNYQVRLSEFNPAQTAGFIDCPIKEVAASTNALNTSDNQYCITCELFLLNGCSPSNNSADCGDFGNSSSWEFGLFLDNYDSNSDWATNTADGTTNILKSIAKDDAKLKMPPALVVGEFTPNQVSPVLKTVLKLEISGPIPEFGATGQEGALIDNQAAVPKTFAAFFVNKQKYPAPYEAPEEDRIYGWPQQYDGTNLHIGFPGAPQGTYHMALVHNIFRGVITANYPQITITSKVLEYTGPSGTVTQNAKYQCSIYGGCVFKIKVENASADKLDNNVYVAGLPCYTYKIEDVSQDSSSSISLIWAYLPKVPQAVAAGLTDTTHRLRVFLKATDEATCEVSGGCDVVEFKEPDAGVAFNDGGFYDQEGKFVTHGTNLGTNSEFALVVIDDVAMPVTEAAGDSLVAPIAGLKTNKQVQVQVFPNGGLPADAASPFERTITPFITYHEDSRLATTDEKASEGGSHLRLRIKAIGTQENELNLVDGDDKSVCFPGSFKRDATDKEVFSCHILQGERNGKFYLRSFEDRLANFAYNTKASPATLAGINVDSTDASGLATQVTLTITAAPSTDKPVVYFGNQIIHESKFTFDGTAVTINTESLQFGVEFFRVLFDTNFQDFVFTPDTIQAFNNVPADLSQILTTPSSCSAAGCAITSNDIRLVEGARNGDAWVTVCDLKCPYEKSLSGFNCFAPSYISLSSIADFEVADAGVIKVLDSFTDKEAAGGEENSEAYDGEYVTKYESDAETCFIRVQLEEGNQKAIIEAFEYYVEDIGANKMTFTEGLKIYGHKRGTAAAESILSDTTESNLILLRDVSAELVDKWNLFKFDDEVHNPTQIAGDQFDALYFEGSVKGSCNLGDVKVHGWVGQNTENCPVQLHLPTSEAHRRLSTGLTSHTNYSTNQTINYASGSTKKLVTVEPQWIDRWEPNLHIVKFKLDQVAAGDTVQIYIGGIECTNVQIDAPNKQVSCQPGSKETLDTNYSLVIVSNGQLVANMGRTVWYVDRYSQGRTWGNQAPPRIGEAIHIPKGQTLYVDVNETARISLLMVEGVILVLPEEDDTHLRKIHANHVMVARGGRFQVGTDAQPYTSRFQMTMYGTKKSAEILQYGNKSIGVRQGFISFVGNELDYTWTQLDDSAEIGANSITVAHNVAGNSDSRRNWKAGDWIVIAPSGFESFEAEKRQIKTITEQGGKSVISFERSLEYFHYGKIYTIQGQQQESIDMRAEVGLLTRNVKYGGDEATSAQAQYGAHIMMSFEGDREAEIAGNRIVGRFKYSEFRFVGQAFQLGRYPLHFHLIGNVRKSLVKGCAIHDTFNRALTFHAVHYLKAEDNVTYNTMGHTFFIEDAFETNNTLKNNLAVQVKRSWSLLNTDQTPAAFWITHPNNNFIGNHAAGSDRYGFWFDTQTTSTGPSFNPSVKPEYERTGVFRDNVAHSMGRYGLRVFHNLIPHEDPLNKINPLVSIFEGFIGYKCKRNGAIYENVGNVISKGFKVADNILAGIEYGIMNFPLPAADSPFNPEGITATVVDALVIGRSDNWEATRIDPKSVEWEHPNENIVVSKVKSQSYGYQDMCGTAVRRGIIGPKSNHFVVDNARFYNYDLCLQDSGEGIKYDGQIYTQDTAAALSTCSHCFHPAASDAGARHYTVSNLYFQDVPQVVVWEFPHKGIFHNPDQTMIKVNGDNKHRAQAPVLSIQHADYAWIMPYFIYADIPNVTYGRPSQLIDPTDEEKVLALNNSDEEVNYYRIMGGGQAVNKSRQVRRIAFHEYDPADNFRGMHLNVLRLTDIMKNAKDDGAAETYQDQIAAYIESNKDTLEEEGTITALAALKKKRNDYVNLVTGLHGDLEQPVAETDANHWKWKYHRILFQEKTNPGNANTIPFVTGEMYHLHWRYGLDFKALTAEPDINSQPEDLQTIFSANFTAIREKIEVSFVGATCPDTVTEELDQDLYDADHLGKLDLNLSSPPDQQSKIANWKHGDNGIDIDAERWYVAVNGKHSNQASCGRRLEDDAPSGTGTSAVKMRWRGIECISLEKCFPGLAPAEKENFLRYWSVPRDWEDLTVTAPAGRRLEASIQEEYLNLKHNAKPVSGDFVEVKEGRTMIYNFHAEDDNQPPALKTLWVNGNLIVPLKKVANTDKNFLGEIDYDDVKGIYDKLATNYVADKVTETFVEAEHIYIRLGRLFVGIHPEAKPYSESIPADSKDYQFQGKFEIRLKGRKQDQHTLFSGTIEAGNKVVANSGMLSVYGNYDHTQKMARLQYPADPQDTTYARNQILLKESEISSWAIGDAIALAPSGYTWMEGENFTITKKSEADAEGNVLVDLDKNFEHYHFGAIHADGDLLEADAGIDVRTEVIHLERRIKFRGVETYEVKMNYLAADANEGTPAKIYSSENEEFTYEDDSNSVMFKDGDLIKDRDGRRFTIIEESIGEGELATTSYKIIKKGDNWGGQVVTTDWKDEYFLNDPSSGEQSETKAVSMRRGRLYVEGAEFINMSQMDTNRAAIRIKNSQTGTDNPVQTIAEHGIRDPGTSVDHWHVVRGNSFHHGQAWAVNVDSSYNVKLEHNVVHYHVAVGFQVTLTTNAHVNHNVISMITDREWGSAAGMMIDILVGLFMCGRRDGVGNDPCPGLQAHYNIVAGTADICAIIHGDKIGTPEAQATSYMNTVHSCKYGYLMQENDYIINEENAMEQQFGWQSVYHTTISGIDGIFGVQGWDVFQIRGVDNSHAVSLQVQSNDKKDTYTKLRESTFSGSGTNTKQQKSSTAIRLPTILFAGKAYPPGAPMLPFYKNKGEGAWYQSHLIDDCTFYGFNNDQSKIMGLNPTNADYQAFIEFTNNKFIKSNLDKLIYIMDPPLGWASIDDCGEFPCTAPENFAIYMSGTTLTESTHTLSDDATPTSGYIIPNNEGFAQPLSSGQSPLCKKMDSWNGYWCKEVAELGILDVLLFENDEGSESSYHRTISPINMVGRKVTNDQPFHEGEITWVDNHKPNALNSFMDHVWDGFYTGQTRRSRFPALVQTGAQPTEAQIAGTAQGTFHDFSYEIEFTGTPPGRMVYALQRKDVNNRLHVRIDYPKAGLVNVYTGLGLQEKKSDYTENKIECEVVYPDKPHSKFLPGEKCGECRWVPVENVLEFTIMSGCQITTMGEDALYGMVEIKWTFDEFFAAGGNTKFVDRLASSLGIHASRIKTVGAVPGSTIIHYFITKDEELKEDPSKSKFELRELNDMLYSLFASGELEKHLEMPILRVENYYTDPNLNTEEPQVVTRAESNIKYPVLALLILSAVILVVGIIMGFVLIRKRTKYEPVDVQGGTSVLNAKGDTLFTDNKFDLEPSVIDDEKLPETRFN